jgi:translocation and assembly module TamB
MSPGKRIAVNTLFALSAVVLCVIGAVSVLQSDWLKNRIRTEIVSAIERVSGGRVELGSIDYNWRKLTIQLNDFVVHGTEASSAPPLAKANFVRLGLTVVSLLKRDIDIASLIVDHPEINLVFQKNGLSNLPTAIHTRVEDANVAKQFLNLRVKRYQLRDGTVQINLRRFPLNVHGTSLAALLAYDSRHHSYAVHFYSRNTSSWPPAFANTPIELAMNAQLQQNRIAFEHVTLRSANVEIAASGSLNDFADPKAVLDIKANFAASKLAGLMRMPALKAGQVTIIGEGRYDRINAVRFKGHMSGTNIAYTSSTFAVSDARMNSSVAVDRQGATFDELYLRVLQGQFTGQLVTTDHQFRLRGDLRRISLPQAFLATLHRQTPWAALISGPLQLSGSIRNDRIENAIAQGALQLVPGDKGIPLSGTIEASYQQTGAIATISSAHLVFGATQLIASGTVGKALQLTVGSGNLQDFQPVLLLLDHPLAKISLPVLLPSGKAQFAGTVSARITNPHVQGTLTLTDFILDGDRWTSFQSRIDLSPETLRLASFSVERDTLRAKGNLEAALTGWHFHKESPVSLEMQFAGANLPNILPQYIHLPPSISLGVGSGTINLTGSFTNPRGQLALSLDNVDLYGERVNRIQFHAATSGETLQVTDGRIDTGRARVMFSGVYKHVATVWTSGQISVRTDSNNFRLGTLLNVQRYDPTLDANLEAHGTATANVEAGKFRLETAKGSIVLENITAKKLKLGNLAIDAVARARTLSAQVSGALHKAPVSGIVDMQLSGDLPARGHLSLGRLELSALDVLLNEGKPVSLPFTSMPVNGSLQGGLTFEGPMLHLARLRMHAHIDRLQVVPRTEPTGASFLLENEQPIVLDAVNGIASITSFKLTGRDTKLSLAGSFPYLVRQSFNLTAAGSIDLALMRLFRPEIQAAGECQLSATVGGTLRQPKIDGLIQIRRGLIYPNTNNLPDGLSGVNGTIKFDGNRATIERLTARSGGGEVSALGFVSFGNNAPVVYRLEAQAAGVRIRYAGGISVTGNSTLRLTGTSASSLLSGTITVTKVTLNPNTDLGSLIAASSAPTPMPVGKQDFASGLQLDIHVESAANMQVNTSLSENIEAEIDLRLRGKPSYPSLLGKISANQGTIKIFGANYAINRGEVSFITPVKIEPVLDLDVQTQARGISVDITVSGTPGRLNINYRSDPPLQPRDIIALLAVGRAPDLASNLPNAQVTNDLSALQSGANTVLGHAFAPVSNRLSKLFGITNIKIDPLVQGISNTPQARLTLQQQISRDISVTYVTNLAQTSEQIFRFEWALNRQYSIVALRDDNGEFGIDIQYKKQFK